MSEADEMFEKLGYRKKGEKFLNITIKIYYEKETLKTIVFYLDKQIFDIFGNPETNMQELQAINKKVEELGWI